MSYFKGAIPVLARFEKILLSMFNSDIIRINGKTS